MIEVLLQELVNETKRVRKELERINLVVSNIKYEVNKNGK